jgi:hypothetical protein
VVFGLRDHLHFLSLYAFWVVSFFIEDLYFEPLAF